MENVKNKYDVSVVVPTYNRSKLLSFTLDSLLKQKYSKDKFEVVVGDDGSSDDTKELVDKYKQWMNVKYVFQEDKGYRPGSARNKAIRLAEGRVCLLVDAGVIMNTNCIAEHHNFHAQKKSRSAAIGYVYGFDHNDASEDFLVEIIDPYNPEISIERLSSYSAYRDVREPQYSKYNDRIEDLPAAWFYFWTCHVSIDMKDLAEVGLFDENYDGRWGMEDQDLGFRLQQHGVKICLLRSASSIHYPHDKDRMKRHMEGYQNCAYFNHKFRTVESKIYLEHYLDTTLVDINEISLSQLKATYS